MIRFSCPKCHTSQEVQAPGAGGTVFCPSCGHRLQIKGAAAGPEKTAPQPTAKKPAGPSDFFQDEDGPAKGEEKRPRRKGSKQKEKSKTLVWVAVGVGVGVVGVGVLIIVLLSGDSGKAPLAAAPSRFADPSPPASRSRERQPESKAAPAQPQPLPPPETKPPPDELPTLPAAGPVDAGEVHKYVLKSICLIINVEANRQISIGTGSIIDAKHKLILTNYHVVENSVGLLVIYPMYEGGKLIVEQERYLEKLKERRQLTQGQVFATDTMRDLALVRVEQIPEGAGALPLARANPTLGQNVHSIGNPGASDAFWVYTPGVVRQVYKKKWRAGGEGTVLNLEAEIVETQSPTNPGDSGGPLVNDRGELIGVTQGGAADASLLSIFISVTEARGFIERSFQDKLQTKWLADARPPLRGSRGSPADLTAIIKALENKEVQLRQRAAQMLGDIGPDAKLAIPALLKLLKDPDQLAQRMAQEALNRIGPPAKSDVAMLIPHLKDDNPAVRGYAVDALGKIGPEAARTAVPALIAALKDQEFSIRLGAALALGKMGAEAREGATPALTGAMEDAEKQVRLAAAESLAGLGADVKQLVVLLRHKDADVRLVAARALGKLGPEAKPAVPELIEAFKSQDRQLRRAAVEALAQLGPEAKVAVPVFLEALKDAAESAVRLSALQALGQLGKDLAQHPAAITALLEAVKDKDVQIKKAALAAVAKVGGSAIGVAGAKQIMPALIEALQGKDVDLRDQAMETVAGIGPQASGAIAALVTLMEKRDVKLLQDDSGKISIKEADDAFLDKIAKALGKIGLPAVKPLINTMNTTNINLGIFIGSCRALGEIGPIAKEAVRRLQAISQADLPPPICLEADRALRRILVK